MTIEFEMTPATSLAASYKYFARDFFVKLVDWFGFAAGPIIGILMFVHHHVARTAVVVRVNGQVPSVLDLIAHLWVWMGQYYYYVGGCTLLGYLWWQRAAPGLGEVFLKGLSADLLQCHEFWGPRSVTIDDDGFSQVSPARTTHLRWWAIERIRENNDFVYVVPITGGYFSIPKASFGDESEAAQFVQTLSNLIASAKAKPCLPIEAEAGCK